MSDTESTHKAARTAELSVDEAERRYPGQWILMKVTGVDGNGNPIKGEVLASHSSRRRISSALSALDANSKNGRHGPFFVFHTPPHAGVQMAKRVLGVSLWTEDDTSDRS